VLKIGAISPNTLLAVGGVVVLLYLAYQAKNAVGNAASTAWDATTNAANAINPLNNNNVIYQGANAALGTDSIGGSIFDFLNPNATGLAPAPDPWSAGPAGGVQGANFGLPM
jgi:hypothetical protein